MKHLSLLCLSFALLPVISGAQTKKISYKSHSGNTALFAAALENELFDISFSNFGMAPERYIRNAKLDTVIFLSEHKAIMVTSEYCGRPDKNPTLWRAGRDTVTDHPLFSRQHSLDSIKKTLKEKYYFNGEIEDTRFIGYDNKKKKYKQAVQPAPVPPSSSSSQQKPDEQIILPVTNANKGTPPDNSLPLYIGILVVASLFSGLFSWNYRQSKEIFV
jgi:hypothetical protein